MLAYEIVMGKPVVFWTGLLSFVFFLFAVVAVIANRYAGMRFIVNVHRNLAIAGLVLGVVHLALALSIYL